MPDKFIEGVAKEKIEKRINNYNEILNSETRDKTDPEYIRAQDVIEEIVSLLKKSKQEYSFVESIEIENEIKYYQKMLKYLDKDYLANRRVELEKKLADERSRLLKLREEPESTGSSSVDKEYIDKATDELREQISNREAMMVARGNEMAPEAYEQLNNWRKELSDLEQGIISSRILKVATNLEIEDLTERISNREAMMAARSNEMAPEAYEQLNNWKSKIESLKNPLKDKSDKNKSDNEIADLEKSFIEHEFELKEITDAEKDLEGRDENDIPIQKSVVQNRIEELQDINKEKELFKINEKGEVTIDYPEITYEPDKEAIKAEYQKRRQDMLDKFYGNKARGKEYAKQHAVLQAHIIEKEFEFVNSDGKKVTSTYKTVEPYEGMEESLSFLQLEEFAERLERLTKVEAGDLSVYNDVYERDDNGKIVKLSPEDARKADKNYIVSDNNAYNKLISTRDNLKTLGKYGEKVDYAQFQKGQPVRNIVRAVGNAGKFVRNNVTAPINKFVGSKIVSPIYGKVVGVDYKVAGLYSNKRSHRYVARREYFESQGKGYFSSRWNSIFNAKEGNKAILSAGAYDIQQSLIKKYTQIAQQEAMQKKTEFATKSVDEKIKMLKADLEKTSDPNNQAKLKATIEDLEKAQVQIARDRELNERTATAQTIQTDAVDIRQHDIANKENVNRTITGVKMISRFGIRKFVGPKIKDWLVKHITTTKEVSVKPTTEELQEALGVKNQKWVKTTYKEIEKPAYETRLKSNASMSDMMSANAGKQIEGYYSVYGGEAKPAMYELKGNEKITAIFQKTGDTGGYGLSDTAGLKAPTLTDGTFAKDLIDANGVLKQDTTINQILDAIGNGSIQPDQLNDVYVAVGDKYWTKLSDLCKEMTQEVQVGTTVGKVVDVRGHMQELSSAETIKAVEEAVSQKLAQNPDFLKNLYKTTTETVPNTRVINALKGLGIGVKSVDGALLVDDVYENTRKTKTNIDWKKPENRNYDMKTQFAGSKKEDMKKASRDEGNER
jgi:hypothetical protein